MDRGQRIELLGVPFDGVTMRAAVGRCLEWCAAPRASHTVITMNAATLCKMRRDPELKKACLSGDLIVPDGMPFVWASRLARVPLPERVAGVDLMAQLLSGASANQLSIYLLGARREVVSQLAGDLPRTHPGLTIAGFRDGYFSPHEHAAIVEEIRDLKPHMLFVGMPSPFKETWCELYRARLEVPVIVGVGGSFDVLTGHVRRAPRWLQSMGMEWAWRLSMEPRKMWKRYLSTNGEFLWLLGREILSRRLKRRPGNRVAG